MLKSLKIAIVGSGTAGLAAAAFLSRADFDVTIFERFEHPRPLGAGLLLQPTGLDCLGKLGLDDKALQYGARINNLFGKSANGRVVFDISYRNLKPRYFGLGIHRGALFSILHEEVLRLNIPIKTGFEIINSSLRAGQRFLTDSNAQEHGPFDLLVDASGMGSRLRKLGRIKLEQPYPYAAIWGVVDDPGQTFGTDYLQQRYDGARIMIGMLPIGTEPGGAMPKAAFFWSLPPGGYETWLQAGLAPWKDRVLAYWPELMPFMAQFTGTDALTFARYGDIVMKRWDEDRLVFIGDAAHNTSPQLGQGANLALADALVLSTVLKQHETINAALRDYTSTRKRHIAFYQLASRWLTPFFQSDSNLAAWIRDASFGLLCKTPYLKTEMLKTLAGTKTGLFTEMNPGAWHPNYDLVANNSDSDKPL